MFGITPEKLALYKKNYAYIPDDLATLFLSKIYHLECLFSLGINELQQSSDIDVKFVETTHYSFQQGPLIEKSLCATTIDNFILPISHLSAYHNREIRALREINKTYPQLFNINSFSKNEAILFLEQKTHNFMSNMSINKETRFNLYKKHAPFFLHTDILPFFSGFIDKLAQKKEYQHETIELFNEKVNLIEAQPWSQIKNKFPLYSEKAIEFFFQNIAQNHIFSAIEQIFDNKNYIPHEKDILTININPHEKLIQTFFTSNEYEINIFLNERNALLPEEINPGGVIQIKLNDISESLQQALQLLWKKINVKGYDKPHYLDFLHKKFLIKNERERLSKGVKTVPKSDKVVSRI